MLTFSEYVSEMAQDEVSLSPADVDRLKAQFGPGVGQMGRWTADGSLIVDSELIREASFSLDKKTLFEAARALKESTGLSSIGLLIEKISSLNQRRYEQVCRRYQETTDPDEERALQQELIRQTFPS